MKNVLANRAKEIQPVHRTSIIFPSEMAKTNWCPRATYFRMSGVPDPVSKSFFTMENVFAEGNAIHSKWQGWLSETGKLWGDWKCSRCAESSQNSLKPSDYTSGSCVGTGWVKLGTSHFTRDLVSASREAFPHDWRYKEVTLRSVSLPVGGHADAALTESNILVELKSIGIGTLKYESPKLIEENSYTVRGKKILDIDGLWKSINRPLTSHLRQGNIYLWMAKEIGLPFDRISFIYEFKANQQVKEFVVPMSIEVLQPMLDTAKVIKDALRIRTAPDCPYNGCSLCKPYSK